MAKPVLSEVEGLAGPSFLGITSSPRALSSREKRRDEGN
jgi:hypothetical protein